MTVPANYGTEYTLGLLHSSSESPIIPRHGYDCCVNEKP